MNLQKVKQTIQTLVVGYAYGPKMGMFVVLTPPTHIPKIPKLGRGAVQRVMGVKSENSLGDHFLSHDDDFPKG